MEDHIAASAASPAQFSIDDFDAVALGAKPHEFEYVLDDGRKTGIFIQVYGSQSEIVQNAINEANNERRREQAARDAILAAGGRAEDFRPVEDDTAFGNRLAAVRIAGWRGLKDKFTPANALRLCTVNADIKVKVVNEANQFGNFIQVSLPKS